MNVKKIIKLFLDIIMAVVFALLFNKAVLGGLSFHEIAGLAIGFFILIHLILNFKWIRQITINIFKPGITPKTRLGYILNVLLFLALGFIIASGILTSEVVFPYLRLSNPYTIGRLHVAVSYLTVILVGIHLGLHWDWIKGIFRNIFRITARKRILSYAVNAIIISALIFGSYSIYNSNFFSQLSMIARSSDKELFFKDGTIPSPDQGNAGGKEDAGAPSDAGSAGVQKDKESVQQLIDELRKQGKTVIVEDKGKGNAKDGVKDNVKGDAKDGVVQVTGKEQDSSNAWQVLSAILSMIAVFAIITGFIERLLKLRRKRPVLPA